MLEFKTFHKIAKDAKKSILTNSNGEATYKKSSNFYFFVLFNFLPILVGIISWFTNTLISEIDNYIGTVISIFTGLFFTLLLGISDKITGEKSNPDKDNIQFQKYKENMSQIAKIVLYIILMGIEIFILLLLNSMFGHFFNGYIEIALTMLVSIILVRFIISLLFVAQRFYYTSRDEINNIL